VHGLARAAQGLCERDTAEDIEASTCACNQN